MPCPVRALSRRWMEGGFASDEGGETGDDPEHGRGSVDWNPLGH